MPCTKDVSISFLPLAHMFERVVQVGGVRTFPSVPYPADGSMIHQSVNWLSSRLVYTEVLRGSFRWFCMVLGAGWASSRETSDCCLTT